MKYFCSFLFLFVSAVLISSCSHQEKHLPRDIASLKANGGMEGIWFLQGSSSTHGPFNGELELRKSSDGTFDVVRVVTYINYFFDGLKVQEVWTGKAVATSDSLTVSYDILKADFITRLGTSKRNPEDFHQPANITSRFAVSAKGITTKFDINSSSYTEWITTRRDLEKEPLWINHRTKIDAKGQPIPLFVRGVIKGFKAKIGYEKDPLVKSYSKRPEYKNEQPYVIFDPTDFDFYRANKDIIRVVNKVTDDISITESVTKRNAYSPTLQEKAVGFEEEAQRLHINPAGMLSHAELDNNGNLVSHIYDGDSGLWTGMYIGSQAMRYMTTKDTQALNNVRKSLRGLFTMMDITGDPTEFARTLEVYAPNKKFSEKWERGTGKFQNLMWMKGGNNDMVKGIFHGFMWAALVIPETDQEIWSELKEKSMRLLKLKVVEEKAQNRPLAYGLAALINKDGELKKEYVKSYSSLAVKVRGYSFDTSFYWNGTADWSGINLGMVGDITAIKLADALGEGHIRYQLRERLMDSWVTYSPAQRHLLTLAAYAHAYKLGVRGENFKEQSSDKKFMDAVEQAKWGLREIPYPRPNLDVAVDHSLNPEWSMSPIPRLFWKAAKSPMPPVPYFYQGLYMYPVFELEAYQSNFVWKESAFKYATSNNKEAANSGVDFLYAYWLARSAGIDNVN